MTRILAIDPGDVQSAWALIDPDDCRPVNVGKAPNREVRTLLRAQREASIAIEWIASYGMPVGREVFETCLWVGRYVELVDPRPVQLVYRADVKLHHCHSRKAKDGNVTQALVDRFAPGQSNYGKGTKKQPGWFYGFHRDLWSAYAVAVYVVDTR